MCVAFGILEPRTSQFDKHMQTHQPIPAPGAPVVTPGQSITPTAPYTPGTANPATSPQSQAPQGQAPASPAAEPTPIALDEAKVYLVKQKDGTTVPMTGKQINDGTMMQAAFTQKTQQAAELRKQAEQAIAAVQQLASDPAQFFQYGAQRFGPQVAAQVLQVLTQAQQAAAAPQVPTPQFNPNELATVGQAQQVAQQLVAQALQAQQQQAAALQQNIQQTAQQVEQRIRDTIEVAKYNDQINPVVKGLFDAHPILKAVPHAEDAIRFEVLQLKPQTPEQAIQAFQQVASRHASAITQAYQELNKQQAVQQQQLVTQGIMPPGGAPVTQQPQFTPPQRPDGRVDWNQLGAHVTAEISRAFAAQ